MRDDVVDLVSELRSTTDHGTWDAAIAAHRADREAWLACVQRSARVTVLASHTTDFFNGALAVAGVTVGLDLDVVPAPFGQFEQVAFAETTIAPETPSYVLLAPTVADLGWRPEADLDAAVERWTRLWASFRASGLRVVQHLFVVPWDDPLGEAGATLPSVASFVEAMNRALREAAGDQVLVVDCDRLAAEVGKRRWRDERYWIALRQAVSFEAIPRLAQATAGTLAADLGLTRRCIIVDLDNTLWNGILGEDGIDGVSVGDDLAGEPFARFQEHLAALARSGFLLAIASKNDEPLVLEALRSVRGMRLREDRFAAIVADWRPKSEQLRDVAERTRLPLSSLCFVDDNPAECLEVRRALPDVDVVALRPPASDYVSQLAGRPTLQLTHVGPADVARAASYAAVRAAESARPASWTLDDFLDDLRMSSRVRRVTPRTLQRVAQLVQKTNQFNLTSRRHSLETIEALVASEGWICLTLELDDRFAAHGLVGVALLELRAEDAVVDTLLLSCRVIGRGAERRLLAAAAAHAAAGGAARLVGELRRTERNGLVQGLYRELGFSPCQSAGEVERFSLSVADAVQLDTPHIEELDD